MILTKKTVSLLLIAIGVLEIIFSAFFVYAAKKRNKELKEEFEKLNTNITNLENKINLAEKFLFKKYFELFTPYRLKYKYTLDDLKSTLSCFALKANFDIDRELYSVLKKRLKGYRIYTPTKKKPYRTTSLSRLLNSCYYAYPRTPHPELQKSITYAKYDWTYNDNLKLPSFIKLLNEYTLLIKELLGIEGGKADSVKALQEAISAYQTQVSKYLDETFDIQAFKSLEEEIRRKGPEGAEKEMYSDLEKKIYKEESINNLVKKYFVLKLRLAEFLRSFGEVLNKKVAFTTGIRDNAEVKTFTVEEIFRSEDYQALCGKGGGKLLYKIPPSCLDLKDTLLCQPNVKLNAFTNILSGIIEAQLAWRDNINEIIYLKQRVDRNDTSLLTEIREPKNEAEQNAKDIILYRQIKKTLEDQIDKIKTKIARQKLENKPVGRILSVDKKGGRAVINIGRKNGLFNNTLFEIYGITRGREFTLKGMAKILRLGEENSKILILPIVRMEDKSFILSIGAGFAEPNTFTVISKDGSKTLPYTDIVKITAVKGLTAEVSDYLYSESFDPSVKRIVSFAGNLHLIFTNAEAEKKLPEWNFIVQKKADINNDFVILGKDYENSENYKIAKELNIRLIREKDFYDLLSLEYQY